jgi:quinohemoprotein ethanol dehydrogenase
VKQEAAWIVEQDHPWNAGTLTTAGNLVFQGRYDGIFLAYDATTGEEVWSYDLGLGISAPPITYELDGTQYIALLVGYGGGFTSGKTPGVPFEGWAYGVHTRRLVAFALDGDTTLPAQPPPFEPEPLMVADFAIDESIVRQGARLYGTYCGFCHGGGAAASAMSPDLRASAASVSATLFAEIVREGILANRAMPPFPSLDDEQLEAIRHYIRAVAHRDAGGVE